MKNHAIRSPVVMGIAGAILGTVAARLIRGATAAHRKERIEWQTTEGRPYYSPDARWAAGAEVGADYEAYSATAGHEAAGPSVGERVREKAADMKDRVAGVADDVRDRAAGVVDDVRARAVDVRDRAVHAMHDVRDRLPSGEQIRGGAQDVYRFATEEQPVLGGILAMGVGMALGFLIPVTDREERLVQPIKDRAVENLGHLDDKVRQLANKLDEKISGGQQQPQQGLQESGQQQGAGQTNPFGASQSRPPFPSA
jgi:hypothetical protein